jgi:hypothetical protein
VQANTIASIEKTNAHMNENAAKSWQSAMADWITNASIYVNCKPPIQPPPPPRKPAMYETEITYANVAGMLVPEIPDGATGQYYAWVETVVR